MSVTCGKRFNSFLFRKTASNAAWPAILAIVLAWVVGCSGNPPKQKDHIKLSDAVSEASKDPEDQKKVAADTYKDTGDDEILSDESDEEDESLLTGMGMGFLADGDDAAHPDDSLDEGPLVSHFGLVLGGGTINGDETDGFSIFGIEIAKHFYADRVRFEAYGLGGTANLHENSALAEGLKREYQLSLGLGGRYYFNPPHTFMGVYALGGYRGGILSWTYTNPIQTYQAGESRTVESDRLFFNELYLGLGSSFWQSGRIQMGLNFSAGYRFYSDYTFNDFENDLFTDEPFLQLMMEVMFAP
jgi:hypothetical protein